MLFCHPKEGFFISFFSVQYKFHFYLIWSRGSVGDVYSDGNKKKKTIKEHVFNSATWQERIRKMF